jgi:hypothetical protein
MSVKYEVDGDIFREMSGNWLYVRVKEYLITARKIETDQDGSTSEYFLLNDGRVFTRKIPAPNTSDVKSSQAQTNMPQLALKKWDEVSTS